MVLIAATVEDNRRAGFLFPANVVRLGYTTNALTYGPNNFFSRKVPIFWGGNVETRRGLGMFVNAGARDRLLKGERERFFAEEWPRIAATIERLGITPDELTRAAAAPKRKER